MALTIRRATYFRGTVQDRPGEAYQLLSQLAGVDVNLLAFGAMPVDGGHTQLVLFPENAEALTSAAEAAGLRMHGPQYAFLVQGDDRLGALADVHARLYDAKINVYASDGVADGRGGFGYIVYVRPVDFEAAAQALGV